MILLNNNINIKSKFPDINPELVKRIIYESNILIGEKILQGEEFLLPFNLGLITIVKFKNQKSFDFIHFCKTGEFINQDNIHTFKYLYKIIWTKGLIDNSKKQLVNNIYKFSASRLNIKRPLAKILKSGKDFYKDEDYIERFGNVNKRYLSQFKKTKREDGI